MIIRALLMKSYQEQWFSDWHRYFREGRKIVDDNCSPEAHQH